MSKVFKFCLFFLLAAGEGFRPTFDRNIFDFMRPNASYDVQKTQPIGGQNGPGKPFFSVYKRNS